MIPYLRTENLKNHSLFRGTYLYSPYMGVAPRDLFPRGLHCSNKLCVPTNTGNPVTNVPCFPGEFLQGKHHVYCSADLSCDLLISQCCFPRDRLPDSNNFMLSYLVTNFFGFSVRSCLVILTLRLTRGENLGDYSLSYATSLESYRR